MCGPIALMLPVDQIIVRKASQILTYHLGRLVAAAWFWTRRQRALYGWLQQQMSVVIG
jgi:hypothetical protein